ncbi:hypothetical protein V8C34DRAFT_264582 [Trichoderma compactum]
MLEVMWAVMMVVASGFRINAVSTPKATGVASHLDETPPSNLLTLMGKAMAVDLIPAVGSQAFPHGKGDGKGDGDSASSLPLHAAGQAILLSLGTDGINITAEAGFRGGSASAVTSMVSWQFQIFGMLLYSVPCV